MAKAGVLAFLTDTGTSALELLEHQWSGDWGDVPWEDTAKNRRSVQQGRRILSSYPVGSMRVWIITEANRKSTCLLFLEEYYGEDCVGRVLVGFNPSMTALPNRYASFRLLFTQLRT